MSRIKKLFIMKKLTIIITFISVLCLALSIYSCRNSSSESNNTEDKNEMVSEAFEAEFVGTYVYVGPDTLQVQKCIDSLSAWRAIVDCKGTSKSIGDIKVHFDFCGDEEGNYGNTYAYFVDKSSDTLFISCEGQVKQGNTNEHPSFVVSYWKDDFEILGGTGKFEGATGNGKTDDYNSSEDPNSHHHWTGVIILKK